MSLQGTLRTLGITEVLEFLADRKASGRLDIEADSGIATYWMLDGGIASVDFEFEREAGTDAAEATYYAVAEIDGTFLFNEDEPPAEGSETESVPDVLGRTADIAESWSAVEDVIPTPEHQLTRTGEFSEPVTVQPEWWTAIDAIGHGCSSRQLTEKLGMRALASSLMATEMAHVGLLQIGDPTGWASDVDDADVVTDADEEVVDTVEPFQSEYSEPTASYESEIQSVENLEPTDDDLPSFDASQYDDYAVAGSPEAVIDTATAVRELEEAVGELAAMSAESDEGERHRETVLADFSAAESLEPGNVSTDWPIEDDSASAAPAIDWNSGADPDEVIADTDEVIADTPFEHAPSDDDGWATDHGRSAAPMSFQTPAPVEPTFVDEAGPQPEHENDPQLPTWADTVGAAAVADADSPFSDIAAGGSAIFGSLPDASDLVAEVDYDPTAEQHLAAAEDAPAMDFVDIHSDLGDGSDDEDFGTEDRSSVLKFLRRD